MGLAAGTRLGPYEVLSALGAGGMGEVYLADDPRLGRQVAVKRPSDAWLQSADAVDRLRREARAAARLTHPNIAAIHDVLDIDGRPHIVMEYVEGETLAASVRRGPLDPARVADIGVQLADALVDAHTHGVIHRDLKPGNVMLMPSGRVKVLDFGLARVSEARATPGVTLTDAGRLLGTPGYISPEQLVGHRADERSDIYSAGVLLFELLTGRLLHSEPDAMGRALATLAQNEAPRADAVIRGVPAALGDVVARAMARDPAARFQSAGALRAELVRVRTALGDLPTGRGEARTGPAPWRVGRRPWALGAAAVVLLAVVGLAARQWLAGRGGGPQIVAVLPFVVDPQDADLAAVASGLAEMIVNEVAAADDASAIPRSATVAFRDPAADVRKIAETLRATLVVTGSLQREEGRAVLVLRMTPAGPGRPWERTYRAASPELVSVGNQALADVIGHLGASRVASRRVQSWEAFQQYSQARSFLDRRDIPGNVDRAIQLLQSAAVREPGFALAHAGLGEAYWEQYRATRNAALVDKARDAIMVALSLDPDQPLVRLTLATIFQGTGQTDRAEQELRAVIAKNPLDSAHRALGRILADRGRDHRDAALEELQRAIDLGPGNAANHLTKGVALLRMGRYQDAAPVLARAAELQPDHADAHQYLGTAYLLTGDSARAIVQFRRSLDLAPRPGTWSNLGTALYETRQLDEALEAFRRAVALSPRDPTLRRNLGDMLQRLGRTREARKEYAEGIVLAEDALRVNANSSDTHGILAICYAKIGRFDEATRHADRAVAIAPETADPRHRRAAVLALAGRAADALAALNEAFARGDTAELVMRDEDLVSLRETAGFKELVARNR